MIDGSDLQGSATLSRVAIERALNRLGDLLKQHNKIIELVAAGGVISVLQFGNREATRDIDVIIPDTDRELLLRLIEVVAQEQNLQDGKSAWLNDGVAFFGLRTKSNNVLFKHSHLTLFAADWHELLGMKLSGAWRRDADFDDAVHILQRIGKHSRQETLRQSQAYRNLTPHTDDATFALRFSKVWQAAFGE